MKRATRNQKIRFLYGKEIEDKPGKVWTYRALAARFRITPNAVYYVMHPERRPKKPAGPPRIKRPHVIRVSLTTAEFALLKTRLERLRPNVSRTVRDLMWGRQPPLPEVLDDEPRLEIGDDVHE